MKFISLTINKSKFCINADHIVYMSQHGEWSEVRLSNGDSFSVEESVEAILALINLTRHINQ